MGLEPVQNFPEICHGSEHLSGICLENFFFQSDHSQLRLLVIVRSVAPYSMWKALRTMVPKFLPAIEIEKSGTIVLSMFSMASTKMFPKRFLFCEERQKLYRLVADHHDSNCVHQYCSTVFPLQVVELQIVCSGPKSLLLSPFFSSLSDCQ